MNWGALFWIFLLAGAAGGGLWQGRKHADDGLRADKLAAQAALADLQLRIAKADADGAKTALAETKALRNVEIQQAADLAAERAERTATYQRIAHAKPPPDCSRVPVAVAELYRAATAPIIRIPAQHPARSSVVPDARAATARAAGIAER